ncbi:hypothetical protein ACS0TY_030139 [Phlomoides rotata]
MLLYKQKKKKRSKGNHLLISVTVLGSIRQIQFVVNEEEIVAVVIDTALKSYVHEGRESVLESNLDNFIMYCHVPKLKLWRHWRRLDCSASKISSSIRSWRRSLRSLQFPIKKPEFGSHWGRREGKRGMKGEKSERGNG